MRKKGFLKVYPCKDEWLHFRADEKELYSALSSISVRMPVLFDDSNLSPGNKLFPTEVIFQMQFLSPDVEINNIKVVKI